MIPSQKKKPITPVRKGNRANEQGIRRDQGISIPLAQAGLMRLTYCPEVESDKSVGVTD